MSRDLRNTLRTSTLKSRDGMLPVEREAKSAAIADSLFGLVEVQQAEILFVYMHFRSEVQTGRFIRNCLAAGKRIAIPLTHSSTYQLTAVEIQDPEKDVEPGYCLIPEPKRDIVAQGTLDPGLVQVAVVPGSVFDRWGMRLGYGGGYYDRFLARSAPGALRVGLAYELQLVPEVPGEPHDQRMDLVITETSIYDCREERGA